MFIKEIKDFAQYNDLDAKGSEMDLPNVYKEKEYGKGYKAKPQTVIVRDTKTGKIYGRRTIHQRTKVSEHTMDKTFIQYLTEMDDTIHNSEEYDDHEGDMAVADLRTIVKQAEELLDYIDSDQELQGWVQAKLTKAADYIDSVHRYMTNDEDDVENEIEDKIDDEMDDVDLP